MRRRENEPFSTQAAIELAIVLRGQVATSQVVAWQVLPEEESFVSLRSEREETKDSPTRVYPGLQSGKGRYVSEELGASVGEEGPTEVAS